MKRDTSIILITVGLVVLAAFAIASVPHLINYQGVLTDSVGQPITGSHDLTFTIYPDSAISAPAYWTETHTGVLLDNGLFHVILGPIPDNLFASEERWIGITVDATPEMKPRLQITSVPWALRAAVADTVLSGGGGTGDGHSLDAADGDPTDVVYVDNDGHVGIGTTSPIAPLHVASGSTVLLGADTLGAGSKLMWLPAKSAFRAGYAQNDYWDWANIGSYSTATGHGTTAYGDYSTAMGQFTDAIGDYSTAMGSESFASGSASTAMGGTTLASGSYSTAMGIQTEASGSGSTAMGSSTEASGSASTAMGVFSTASGDYSTAMGNESFASGDGSTAMGYQTEASGDNSTAMGSNTKAEAHASTAIGRYNVGGGDPSSWVDTDPLFEIGNGTSVVNRANAMTVLKNGNVGIGTITPTYKLDVADTVQMASIKMPTGAVNGHVLVSDANGVGSWQSPSGGSLWDQTGSDIYYDAGKVGIGTSIPIAPLNVASGSTVLFGADTLGAGSKLMWLPSKSAFRVGSVNGTQWDWANIGDGSTAMGGRTTASGTYSTAMGAFTSASGNASTAMGWETTASGGESTAMGLYTTASGNRSTAMGWETTASGYTSTAMGWETTASGYTSTAMGEYTRAQSYSSMAIGKYNVGGGNPNSWVGTDPLFEIGYGSNLGRKNAMTVLKNGRIGIRTTSPAYLLQVGESGDGSQARANSWNLLSSREYKKDIESLTPSDYQEVLARVKSTEVVRYRFANDEKKVQHIGVIAEDSPREIVSSDGKAVSLGDYCAFLLAAIKAQQAQIEELKGEVKQLRSEIKDQ